MTKHLVIIISCRVKSVMAHLDGRRSFPRVCIGWSSIFHNSPQSHFPKKDAFLFSDNDSFFFFFLVNR